MYMLMFVRNVTFDCQLDDISADGKQTTTAGAAAAAWHSMPQRRGRQRQHAGAYRSYQNLCLPADLFVFIGCL